MENEKEYKRCFCGSDSFLIKKEQHRWCLICQACKCERVITTPGIGITNYEVSIPFGNDYTQENVIAHDYTKQEL